MGALIGRKRALRVAGVDLGSAERIDDIDISWKSLDQLGRGRSRVLPIPTQHVQTDERQPRPWFIWCSSTRAGDIVHRLRPLSLRDDNVRETEESADVVRCLRKNRLIDLLGSVRATGHQE